MDRAVKRNAAAVQVLERADLQVQARTVKRRDDEKLLQKIWQRALIARDTQAAATCIKLGAHTSWPVHDGDKYVPALQYAAQHEDRAMVFLLLSSAAQGASVSKDLQSWHSALLQHEDYYQLTQWSAFTEKLAAAADDTMPWTMLSARLQLRAPLVKQSESQLQLAAKLMAMPAGLHWGAALALCAVVEGMRERHIRNTTFELTLDMLSSSTATCSAPTWLAAAQAVRSNAAHSKRPRQARAAAQAAVTRAAGEESSAAIAAQRRTAHARAAALRDVHFNAVMCTVLVLLMCWTGLRKRRLYGIPSHLFPVPAQRGFKRSALLLLTVKMLQLDMKVIAEKAHRCYMESWRLWCEDSAADCVNEFLVFVERLASEVVAVQVTSLLLALLCSVWWLLSCAKLSVLDTAVRCNWPRLASLAVCPAAAVTEYSRTRPAVFGTVAAVLKLDKAAAAVVSAFKLKRVTVFLKLDKVARTWQRVTDNTEASLMSFAVVDTACEKGWDAALVLRLLHAWMQSPQCNAAALLAVIVRSKDYAAVRAILRMYELCDIRHPDCVSNYSAASTVNSASLPKRCVMWLENCVIAVCELHAVTDRCHLADETRVLIAVAAVKTALREREQYSSEQRELLVQQYAGQRHACSTTVSNSVVPRLWCILLNAAPFSKRAQLTERGRSCVADTCASETIDEQRVVDSNNTGICDTEGSTHQAPAQLTSTVAAAAATADATDATATSGNTAALVAERDEHAAARRQAETRVQQLEQQLSTERIDHKSELDRRDAEHDAALQQCRDDAAAAAAAAAAVAATKLKAATEQFEELEERIACAVCQHDPKQVLLQPCLHLCLCSKCSTSPKIKDCPICRAEIDYKETVHLC
jgi:Zinc finger, C3HC4 type (RING finger)